METEIIAGVTLNGMVAACGVFAACIIALAGLLGAVNTIASTVAGWKKKTPEAQQNVRQDGQIKDHESRIAALEEKAVRFEKRFINDQDELERIGDDIRALTRGVLALLDHALDGNDISNLEKSRKELDEYLIDHHGGIKNERKRA